MTQVAGESVTVEVVVTLDDQVRYSEFMLSAPDMRRIFYRRWVAAILLMPPGGLAVGMLIGFSTDRSRPPLQDLAGALWSDRMSILAAWLTVAGLMVAMMIAYRLSRRLRLRAQARTLLRERHGIDRADPDLRERARCSFGPDGFRSVGYGGEYRAHWTGVTGLDETAELLIVRTGRFTGFLLPRRDLARDEIDAIRRIVAANAGTPRVGKER